MKRFLLFLIFIQSATSYAQTLTSTQQEALNNYINFANEAKKTGAYLMSSLTSCHETVDRYRNNKKNYSNLAGYRCPVQVEDYYYNKAINSSGLSEADKNQLKQQALKLRKAIESLDRECKSLETYFTLLDYQTDGFRKFDSLVVVLQQTLVSLKTNEELLNTQVKKVYKKLQPSPSGNPYSSAENGMVKCIEEERKLMNLWSYNLNKKINTGFPVDSIRQSISRTETLLAQLKQKKSGMGNYSQTSFNSFIEGLESHQETKRRAVDNYNFEAKQSDEHSNEVYLSLISSLNGMLVADYNNFINLSIQHGYRGVKQAEYIPVYELRSQKVKTETSVAPFKDIPYSPLNIIQQASSVTLPLHKALNNYVNYINASLNQTEDMRQILSNFNSSAVYYKDLTTFKGKGGLTFDPSDYKIPLSSYQTLKDESINVPSSYRKSLNEQAEVLMNIMKEMEGLGIELNKQSVNKLYEQDNLTRVYEILERFKFLLDVFDEKKERLYTDVRKIHESYKVKDPASSWNVSAKELLKLLDLNKAELFKSKKFYKGDSSAIPSSEKIDEQIRNVISNEYTNMKGIEKFGRYNGLCPYSPYEDIPKNSRTFSADLKEVPKNKERDTYSYRHPYHSLAYLYNSFVEDYNKFCELSKTPLLRTINEPELFFVRYPDDKVRAHNAESEKIRLENERIWNERKEQAKSKEEKLKEEKQTIPTKIIHDTVYIDRERNNMDTLYLREGPDKLLSMEGYATNNMVLLLDVSGSMNDPEKLPLMKKSLERLLKIMRKEDELSIVTYSGDAVVALPPTSCKEIDKILKVIESLKSQGTTNGNAGIRLAYKVADQNYIRGGNNRIILATDGEFPVNKESLKLVEKFSGQEIFLSVFYFGKGNEPAEVLKDLSSKGEGNYEHIKPENSDLKLLREAKAKKTGNK